MLQIELLDRAVCRLVDGPGIDSRDGNTRLPKRNGVAGQTADGGSSLTVTIQGGPGDHVWCA